jgi:cystathionine beta-lyase
MFNFSKSIDRKGSYCTQWDYVEDRFGEADLIPFTISDMDFASPKPLIEALKQRLDHPVLGYSRWNHDDFKSAVINWFSTRFNSHYSSDTLVYGPSVIYIISKLISQWSEEGSGIVFHSPAYDAFDNMIVGLNRKLQASPLLKTATGYEIDWPLFETLLADKNNCILLLCSPQNPTGKVFSRSELERISALCQQHQVFVISDEIHMDISFKTHTPWQDFGHGNNWALVSSASKSFNIPALNGAYAFIANETSREKYLFQLKQVDGLSSPPILGVIGLMTAYNQCADWLDALKDYLLENHKLVQQQLREKLPQLDYQIPDACYLAWIDLSPLALDMQQLNKLLIEEYKVAIMPGSTYGQAGNNFVRLNLGCPKSKVELGLSALINAIQTLARQISIEKKNDE